MPFASFRYLSARLVVRRRVAPNLNQKVENATLKITVWGNKMYEGKYEYS